jgi:HlyD family secretion protein
MDSPLKGYGGIPAADAPNQGGRPDRDAVSKTEDLADDLVIGLPRRKIAIAAFFCALFILALGNLYYFYGVATSPQYYLVRSEAVVVDMTGPGILDATNKVTITSRIAGFLSSISVDRNDVVTAGQIIAELDADDIQSQLVGAIADVDAARSAVLEARGNQEKARAALERAEKDLVRRRGLSQSGVVSQVEIDTLETALRQAQAEFDRLTAVEERMKAQVRVAEAQVGVLQHKRAEAQIRSPLNGMIVSRDRSVGDLLTAGVQLFQIVDPRSVIISTRLDESIMGLVDSGQKATLRFTSDPARRVEARVLRISRTVDPETREFVVDVVPDDLPRNWALGQRAQAAIYVPLPPGTLAIPLEFVARRDGQPGVWRYLAGRAAWTAIEAGSVSGLYLQVSGGLSSGDVVLHPKGRYMHEPVSIEGMAR